ncbi:MAG: hypothetical protein O2968_20980 [Acidobacteria bacterium]|nr:hypothetical protein [Acidobacteriota bacterium]
MTPKQSGKASPAESTVVAFLGCLSLAVYLLGNAAFQQKIRLILNNIAKVVERLGW